MSQDRFVRETIAQTTDLTPALRDASFDDATIDRILESLRGMAPMGLWMLLARGAAGERTGATTSSLMRAGAEEGIRRLAERYGLDETHVREALTLLRNGTIERDLSAVAAETARAVGQVPGAVVRSVHRMTTDPVRLFDFIPAAARDLAELPLEARGIGAHEFRRLMHGAAAGPAREFPLFDHTFAALYDIEGLEVLRDWFLDVSEHPSVQLAVLAYAQTQGVNLEREDILAARDIATGQSHPSPRAGDPILPA